MDEAPDKPLIAFFFPTHHEPAKAAVHALLGGLAFGAAFYNAVAYVLRPSSAPRRHLLVNTLVYSALVGFEVVNVRRHQKYLQLAGRHRASADLPALRDRERQYTSYLG